MKEESLRSCILILVFEKLFIFIEITLIMKKREEIGNRLNFSCDFIFL